LDMTEAKPNKTGRTRARISRDGNPEDLSPPAGSTGKLPFHPAGAEEQHSFLACRDVACRVRGSG
jgi:hypothetical protein